MELQGGDAAQWFRALLEAIRCDKDQTEPQQAACGQYNKIF